MAMRDGEEALAALLATAQSVLAASRRPPSQDSDETALEMRLQTLRAEFDTHWTAVRAAAERIDASRNAGSASNPASEGQRAVATEALLEERRALQSTLADRNRTLKVQIDQLRQALCSLEMMDAR